MILLTVFLVVLIIALIIGNVLLSLTGANKQPVPPAEANPFNSKTERVLMPQDTLQPAGAFPATRALEKRMNSLENLVLRAQRNQQAAVRCEQLFRELQELKRAQQACEIEVAALRQPAGKKAKDMAGRTGSIDNKTLHDLVYNVKN